MKTIEKIFYSRAVVVLTLLKIILAGLFSSGYQDNLFVPFVNYFIDNLNNPWAHFYAQGSFDMFPYPPIMLYILSFFYFFYEILPFESIFFQNVLFKSPTIIADLFIFYFLLKLFPNSFNRIIIFYFISPIVLYSSYMHSQLDLIPTAVLFSSVFFLVNGSLYLSAILYGFALGIKHHTIIALPLIVIYLYKNFRITNIVYFILISSLIFIFPLILYLKDTGFFQLVFDNPAQTLIYESYFQVGRMRIYIPLFVAGILYLRFFMYEKINRDLLFAFINLLFVTFILLVAPSPGWHLWISPFVAIFFIKYYNEIRHPLIFYYTFVLVFFLYFLFFFIPEYDSLTLLGNVFSLNIGNQILQNIFFTFLEIILVGLMYTFYKIGIKSNKVYHPDFASIIGIAGDSASGKTTLLNDIKDLLGKHLVNIEGDGDHKWERNNTNWEELTHLDPKANFLYRQAENILSLKSGESIMRVDYDHKSGAFTDKKIINSNDFVILSGLHTLYLPKMRKALDLSIFLDPAEDVRKEWKIERDVKDRGYDKEAVISNMDERSTDSSKFIIPQKEYADIIISYFNNLDDNKGKLALKVVFDSSINMEELLNLLSTNSLEFYHDYSEDLKNQTILLKQEPKKDLIVLFASKLIFNIEEIIDAPKWENGYRGFVQLLFLLILTETLKVKKYV